MIELLKIEIRKVLNYRFYLVLFFVTLILLVGLFRYNFVYANGMYAPKNAFHAWFYSVSDGSFHIFEFLTPLFIVIAYGDSLYDELNNGYTRMVCIRSEFSKYLKAKYIVNSFVAFLSIVIPSLILLILSTILYQHNIPNKGNFDAYWNPHGELMDLYNKNPYIYIVFCIIIMGIFAISYSSLTIAISFFTKNKILVLTFPFIIYTAFQYLTDYFSMEIIQPRLSLLYYLESVHSIAVDIVEYCAIIGISYAIFRISNKIRELIL